MAVAIGQSEAPSFPGAPNTQGQPGPHLGDTLPIIHPWLIFYTKDYRTPTSQACWPHE